MGNVSTSLASLFRGRPSGSGFYAAHGSFASQYIKAFTILGLEECDVASFYTVFKKVVGVKRLRQQSRGDDKDKRGGKLAVIDDVVRVGDLCVHFDEDRTTLSNVLFAYFSREGGSSRKVADEVDGTGAKIAFGSFVLSFWSLLTLPAVALPAFVFHLYDVDESGSLDIKEINRMLTHFFGSDFRRNEQQANLLRSIERLMDRSEQAIVELGEFIDFCKQNSTLLSSINRLHQKLLKMTLGPARWDVLSLRRLEASGGAFLPTEKILSLHSIDAWMLAGNTASKVKGRAPSLAAGAAAGGKGKRRGSTGSIPSPSATSSAGSSSPKPKIREDDDSSSDEEAEVADKGTKGRRSSVSGALPVPSLLSRVGGLVGARPSSPAPGRKPDEAAARKPLEPKQSFSLQPVASTVVSKPVAQPQRKARTVEKVAPLRRSISASQLMTVQSAAKAAAAAR